MLPLVWMGGHWSVVWLVALAAQGGAACERRAPQLAECRSAIRAHDEGALATCRDVFTVTGSPAAGGLYARALADRDRPLADVRAVAALVGDAPGGAEAWNAVGDVLRTQGDAGGSIAAYERALAHRMPAEVRGKVRDAVGLLHQYGAIERYRPAMGYAGLAYQLAARDGDRELRGYVLASIAAMLFEVGAMPAVESLVAEADQVIDESSSFAPSLQFLHALLDHKHGRLALAAEGLERAGALAHERGLALVERDVAWSRIAVALERGDAEGASKALALDGVGDESDPDDRSHHAYAAARVALARGDATSSVEISSRALTTDAGSWAGSLEAIRGRALLALHEDVKAEQSLHLAIASIERLRAEVDLDELKAWAMKGDWYRPFEDLFTLYVAQHRFEDAFAVMQQATARSVLDGLSGSREDRSGSLALELEREGDRIDGARALAHSLRTSAASQPPCMTELRAQLGSRHVLTYIHANGVLWLAVMRPEQPINIVRVGAIVDVSQLVESWLAHPDEPKITAALGELLMPSHVLPAPGTILFVAGDEVVREVAFAALRVGGTRIVDRNPIAYVPSASVLARLAVMPPATGRPVVLADPMEDLPASREEARAVADRLGVPAILGRTATAAALREARHASVLHVAAHSKHTPAGSALRLADRAVLASEIIDEGLSAAVVVLMSCASADPRDRDELGTLSSAFLAAGSRSVVASRWSVDDSVARAFARAFYAAGGASDPVGAVSSAQRELDRAGVPASVWSTFVVFGDSQPERN